MAKIVYYVFLSTIIGACSATNPLERIIAGDTVDIKDYPYTVSITYPRYGEKYAPIHLCGGAIIDENNILTAAHCVVYEDQWEDVAYASIEKLKVHAGTSRTIYKLKVNAGTSTSDAQGSVYDVKSYIIHPNYDRKRLDNDIAIIKLSKPIQFSDTQKPIELTSRPIENGMMGTFTGWGDTKGFFSHKYAENLQKINQTLIDHEECQEMVKKQNVKFPVVLASQICGYNKNKKKLEHGLQYPGLCVGDSGGPLVADNKLVGVASHLFSYDCAVGNPDVYADVYIALDFVKENVEN